LSCSSLGDTGSLVSWRISPNQLQKKVTISSPPPTPTPQKAHRLFKLRSIPYICIYQLPSPPPPQTRNHNRPQHSPTTTNPPKPHKPQSLGRVYVPTSSNSIHSPSFCEPLPRLCHRVCRPSPTRGCQRKILRPSPPNPPKAEYQRPPT